MDRLKNSLCQLKVDFAFNFDVVEISTLKVNQIVKLAIFTKTTKQLLSVLKLLYRLKIHYKVLGNTSNILFVGYIDYPIVFTCKMKDEYQISGNLVKVSAGMQLSRVIEILKRNKLGGIEGLIGIPATIGGALFNNASAFGNAISKHLVSISAFYQGGVIECNANEFKFGYHLSNLKGLVLLSVSFLFENKNEYDIIRLCNEYTYKRTLMQPSGFSLGSVYQKVNGKSAGFYIERAGLKLMRVGGIVVSQKHANFFVNDKQGSVQDFVKLQDIVERKVASQFGVTLIPEIERVGEYYETSCGSSYPFKIQ